MKRLLVLLASLIVATAMSQVPKQYTEVPNRQHVLKVGIGVNAVVFQTDSSRWMKITNILNPGWRFDTVYKANWWKPTEAYGYEPSITAGTTGQYWRGDKTWQTLPAISPSDTNLWRRIGNKVNLKNRLDSLAIGRSDTRWKLDVYDSVGKGIGIYSQAGPFGYTVSGGSVGSGAAIVGMTKSGYGVLGATYSGGTAIYGSAGGTGKGVNGQSSSGNAVEGNASSSGTGGYFTSSTGRGIYASSTSGHAGIFMGGNVGIGLTNPLTRLSVSTSTNATAIYGVSTHGSGIGVNAEGTIMGMQTYSSSGNAIYASTSTGNSGIFMGGNVGIGLTNPSAKLEVNGLAKVGTLQVGAYNVSVTGNVSIPQSATTYTATSPVDVTGTVISIKSDTLTSWRGKQNQGATAYSWGNHASAGYLTSETSHADVVVDGDFGSQGLIKRGASSGVYSIVTDNSSNWDAAYGWGNHSGLYAALSHNQAISTVTGLQDSLTDKYTKAQVNGLLTAKINLADSNSTSAGNYVTRKFVYDTFEPIVSGSDTNKFYRGDKTWQTLPADDSSKWAYKYDAVLQGDVLYTKDTTAKAFLFGKSVPFDGATFDVLDVARIDGSMNVYYGVVNNELTSGNTGLGWNALKYCASNNNTAVGFSALGNSEQGTLNTAVGASALGNDSTGFMNTAIGTSSLGALLEGIGNTAIGYGAGASALGNGNVFIGINSGSYETGSNTLYIDNSGGDTSNALLWANFSTKRIRFNGDVLIKDIYTQTVPTSTLLTDSAGNIKKLSTGFLIKKSDSTGNAPGNYITRKSLTDATASKINKADSTGNASGNYVTRKALVDSIAANVPPSVDVQVFTNTGANTWTKPAGAKWVEVLCIGGGGGGGSGRKGADGSVRCGGGGGASGGVSKSTYNASVLPETVTVSVGVGGTGGASVSSNSTNGNNAGASGESSFGSYLKAFGGGSGYGGTATNGLAGGYGKGLFSLGSSGLAASTTGGSGSNIGAGDGYMSGGGNAGSGITSSNFASAAKNGGPIGTYVNSSVAVGEGGAIGTSGGNGNSSSETYLGTGGGGGGSSVTGNAGAGGNGANYGAGGGGGGAAKNDTGNSGKGGDGAQGIVIVTTYF